MGYLHNHIQRIRIIFRDRDDHIFRNTFTNQITGYTISLDGFGYIVLCDKNQSVFFSKNLIDEPFIRFRYPRTWPLNAIPHYMYMVINRLTPLHIPNKIPSS